MALRDATILKLSWDEKLPPLLQEYWVRLITEIVEMEDVEFRRSVRPGNAVGAPWIIGFWDGADKAYEGRVYFRWTVLLDDGSEDVECHLVACKVRVVPVDGLTTPRSELNGLLILTRLIAAIVRAMPDKPSRIICCGDSECTIASVESMTALLAPYFASRVREVQDTRARWESEDRLNVDPLYHLPGHQNPADQGTRDDVSLGDLGPGSVHQDGPGWMKQSIEDWPVSREFLKNHYDENSCQHEEMRFKVRCNMSSSSVSETLKQFFGIMYYSDSILKVRGIMARVVRAKIKMDRAAVLGELTVQDYANGDWVIDVLGMVESHNVLMSDGMANLATFKENGITFTKGRLGQSMSRTLGVDKLKVLSPTSRLAYLIMRQSHCEDHRRDAGDALLRSRSKAWIVRGRRLAEKVVKDCNWCKVLAANLNKKFSTQQMGDLPASRVDVYCKPFTNISIDFVGVFTVKAMNNARSLLKCYPIVYCCLTTGAVDIRVASKYDTNRFLEQYSGHCSRRGRPTTVYSDMGSQIVKAAEFAGAGISWDDIAVDEARNGTTWSFAPSGCQYRDGVAENMVKAIKATLHHLKEGTGLDYAGLEVLMSRVANIINDRPIGMRVHCKGEGEMLPLTPNHLLLGKTSNTAPVLDEFENAPDKFTKAVKAIEEIEQDWWDKWYSQVFDSLLPYRKWKKVQRNFQVGDVCALRYENKMKPKKADYRLCRVSKVEVDDKGLVRTVWVHMRKKDARTRGLPYDGANLVEQKTGIQRLVLICSADEVVEVPARTAMHYTTSSYDVAWDRVDRKYVQPAVQMLSDASLVMKGYSRYCYFADNMSYRAHTISGSSSGEVFVPAYQADIISDRPFTQQFQDLSLRDSLGREEDEMGQKEDSLGREVDEMAQKEIEHEDFEVKEDVRLESCD